MSLIYDALRLQADPAQCGDAAPRTSWWARQSSQRRGGVLLATGALLAAPLAFVAAGSVERSAVSPVPEPAVLPVVDTRRPQAPVQDTATDADAAHTGASTDIMAVAAAMTSAGAHTSPVAAVIDVVAEPPLPEVVVQAAAPETLPLQRPEPQPLAVAAATPSPLPEPVSIKVERRGAGEVLDGQHDDAAVVQAMRAVEAAVAAGDVPAARDALIGLERVLPGESLTLLRMRAWVAHGGHDMVAAETHYRQIIARVPDDMNAGVNIALLDARRGDIGDARNRLTRLASRHVRSPQIARALAELDTLAQ